MTTRKLTAFQMPVPPPMPALAGWVLLNPDGRMLVDPRMLGLMYDDVITRAIREKQPVYERNGHIFLDFEWLKTGPLPVHLRGEGIGVMKHLFTGATERLPARVVSVNEFWEVTSYVCI